MRALPCELPCGCPAANCSSTTTGTSRAARAHAEAAPARPAPTITTGSEAVTVARLSSGGVTQNGIRSYVDDQKSALLADLDQWLRIPGISAQPDRHGDVRRSAEWFADALRRTG